ncbi:hypothetical protein EJ08DRAFT_664839 [Tothia fuscella]|uniref:SUZ domain-containing protein n=1 Tax=Tothia fuscella TaxID=1048955 RepID=A0A9P4NIH0_9PEZI|nr:hypothetical protein EJ08DRAFT_664839 [Tothia fuscella]
MSKKKGAVPDAWDDDWEAQADKIAADPQPQAEPVKLTHAERKAMHAETNKQIWEAAETPNRPIFLQARSAVPPIADFKPTMKVLARKPPPKVATTTAAMANTSIEDDPDSEEEERRRKAADFAERSARAQREREEKQRKYQEVRDRLFGSIPTTGSTSGGDQSRSSSTNENGKDGGRNSSRGKGRRGKNNNIEAEAGEDSPARPSISRKQLYDPGYTPKPNSTFLQKREGVSGTTTPSEEKPLRAPRGPDGSGRGGHGFAPRGKSGTGGV